MGKAAYNLVAALGHVLLFSWQCVMLIYRLGRIVFGLEKRDKERVLQAERQLILREASVINASTGFGDLEGATIFSFRVVDSAKVDLGTLKFWYCTQSKSYYRDFTFLNKDVSRALGVRNIPMSPQKVSKGDAVTALREESMRELEKLLQQRFSALAAGSNVQPTSNAVLPAPAFPQQRYASPANAPRQAYQPVQDVNPKPATAQRQFMARQATPAPVRPAAPAARSEGAKVVSVDEGVYLNSGLAKRVIRKNKPGGSEQVEIEQFYLDIRLTSAEPRGAVRRIWGADLERAIQDSQAQRDSLIRVAYHGRVLVKNDSGDGESYKNLYEITCIGGRR